MSFLQAIGRTASGAVGRDSPLIRRMRPYYETLLNWSSGGGIKWVVNDVPFRIDAHYRHMLAHAYDAPVAQFLRERIRPGALCIDVGANVGVYVLQMAHWSKPAGTVIAFEPNPAACGVLERHIRLNSLSKRVTVVPEAVSDSPGDGVLYAAQADGMSRLGAPNDALAGRTIPVTVQVTTLDAYCSSYNISPDWILIDIEGFEIAALKGSRQTIARGHPEVGLIVEMHPGIWNSTGTSRAEAEAILQELKLQPVSLTGQKDPLNEHGIVWLKCS